ncbi:MAG: serine hydrolase [Gammaproteobacteria bacterium]|jgi:D-alanyl-D-alanine endopeptidase (penicillin-binding protein 7)
MRHKRFIKAGGALLMGLWTLWVLPGASFVSNAYADDGDLQVSAEDIVRLKPRAPFLRSAAALVMDEREGVVLYSRHKDEQLPIASVTKLMTAMVTLDRHLPMDKVITISPEDRDHLRGSASRLRIGVKLTRHDVLLAALAASDNRAAAALARTYPGGRRMMLRIMNEKARLLGMSHTHYADAAGLNNGSASTAGDLAILVNAAIKYPLIRKFTTTGEFSVTDRRRHRPIQFVNTNRLVRSSAWDINLSKTGYTDDAGNCLVMETVIGERPVIIVLLDSWGKLSKYGDSRRIREWLIRNERRALRLAADAPT